MRLSNVCAARHIGPDMKCGTNPFQEEEEKEREEEERDAEEDERDEEEKEDAPDEKRRKTADAALKRLHG